MKDSASSRELKSHSNWKVLVPAGTELLLAHAISDPYLTFCSWKYMSMKLLFLPFCHSWWDFCQPYIEFLSCLACILAASCCLSACLVTRWEGCLDALCHGAWMQTNLSWSMVLAPLKGSHLPSVLSLAKTALGHQLMVVFSALWFLQVVL